VVTDAGTVQVRVANSVLVVGVVAAVANESTQSPFDATAIVMPIALSTVEVHVPLVTVSACTGDTITVDGIAKTVAARTATIPENRAMRLHIRIDRFILGSVGRLRTCVYFTCITYTIMLCDTFDP
jgi:hypothetical protein